MEFALQLNEFCINKSCNMVAVKSIDALMTQCVSLQRHGLWHPSSQKPADFATAFQTGQFWFGLHHVPSSEK